MNTPIADRIRRERRRASLTQAQLAEALGVGQPQVARWEGGQRAPSVASLDRIAGVLGIPTMQFFQCDGDVSP